MDIMSLTKEKLAKMMDYGVALEEPNVKDQIRTNCAEALKYGFPTFYVAPYMIPLAKKELKGSKTRVGGPFAYPWGEITTESKIFQLKKVIDLGAEAVDGVINVSALKSGDINYVKEEVEELVSIAREKRKDMVIKMIIESCWLSNEEIVTASRIIKDSGADFVKTSTGWGPMGCTTDQIKLIRETVGPDFGVKAGGGTSGSIENVLAMIEAGANRFGEPQAVRVIESLEYAQQIRGK